MCEPFRFVKSDGAPPNSTRGFGFGSAPRPDQQASESGGSLFSGFGAAPPPSATSPGIFGGARIKDPVAPPAPPAKKTKTDDCEKMESDSAPIFGPVKKSENPPSLDVIPMEKLPAQQSLCAPMSQQVAQQPLTKEEIAAREVIEDVCGINGQCKPAVGKEISNKWVADNYCHLSARVKSFYKWPSIYSECNKSPRDMARAGFIRENNVSDGVRCVFCRNGLHEWRTYDNPFTCHINWCRKHEIHCKFIEYLFENAHLLFEDVPQLMYITNTAPPRN